MLLFETKLFKAVYLDFMCRVDIYMCTPDVKDSWRLVRELKATSYTDANFVAKSFVLDLVLDVTTNIKVQNG